MIETTIRKDATDCPHCCSKHVREKPLRSAFHSEHSISDLGGYALPCWWVSVPTGLQFSPTILKFYNDSTRLNYKPIWPMTPQLKGHLIFNCIHFNHYRLQGMFTWFKVEVSLQAEKMTLTKNLSFLLTSVQRKTRFQSKQNLQGRPDGPCSQCQYKGLDVRLADKSVHCSARL